MLIDKNYIKDFLTKESPWAESHGAIDDYLGFGMIYYGLVYSLQSKNILVLGSGGGFVPRVFCQAQRDTGIEGKITLVDGDMGRWGRPLWLQNDSFFKLNFPEIRIIIETTDNAFKSFSELNEKFDLIHIDADHSYKGARKDFDNYRELIKIPGVITLHDTNGDYPCAQLAGEIRNTGLEVVNFKEYSQGLAIVKF